MFRFSVAQILAQKVRKSSDFVQNSSKETIQLKGTASLRMSRPLPQGDHSTRYLSVEGFRESHRPPEPSLDTRGVPSGGFVQQKSMKMAC